MIVFRLTCPSEHEFDAWFRDGAAFEEQVKKRIVTCPECGSAEVSKAIMAPRLSRGRSQALSESAEGSAPSAPRPESQVTAASAHREEFVRLMTALREHVEKSCDYVGEKFADEARRIHYGEAEQRDIYGETTVAEAKELVDEGIKIAPVPGFPRRDS